MGVETESAGRFALTILMKQKDQSWTRCLLSPWTTITTFPSSSTDSGRPSTRMSSLPSRSQCSSSLLRIERKLFSSDRESRTCWPVEGQRKSCRSFPSWSFPSNVSIVQIKMILQIKFDHFYDQTDDDWDPENEFSSFSVALNTRRDDVMCRTLKVFLKYDEIQISPKSSMNRLTDKVGCICHPHSVTWWLPFLILPLELLQLTCAFVILTCCHLTLVFPYFVTWVVTINLSQALIKLVKSADYVGKGLYSPTWSSHNHIIIASSDRHDIIISYYDDIIITRSYQARPWSPIIVSFCPSSTCSNKKIVRPSSSSSSSSLSSPPSPSSSLLSSLINKQF